MADKLDKAVDLVLSYVVGGNGTEVDTHKPLQDALDQGYRVVDIIPTSFAAGGNNGGFAPVAVTVLLSLPKMGGAYKGGASS